MVSQVALLAVTNTPGANIAVEWWAWVGLVGLILALLVFDLVLFGRGAEVISFRRAATWSLVWAALGFLFTIPVWLHFGRQPAEEYLAGFLLEKSLSVDNLFVFALIFAYFAVPREYQRRVIFWGIVGAIVLRAVFIFAGATLLDLFHWMIYVFGGFLILTGIRMARHDQKEIHPEQNPALRLVRRAMPMTNDYHGDKFFIREGGRRAATPMLASLVLVAVFDVVFAIDSIPAIFAITRDVFIVFSANAFSLLGLAALYFLLAGMIARFRYLNIGLAVVLVFVGIKMVTEEVLHIPALLSLLVIVATLGVAVAASWWASRGEPIGEEVAPPSPHAPGPPAPRAADVAGEGES